MRKEPDCDEHIGKGLGLHTKGLFNAIFNIISVISWQYMGKESHDFHEHSIFNLYKDFFWTRSNQNKDIYIV